MKNDSQVWLIVTKKFPPDFDINLHRKKYIEQLTCMHNFPEQFKLESISCLKINLHRNENSLTNMQQFSEQGLAFLFLWWWNPCQSAMMNKRYNRSSLPWIIREVLLIPSMSKMSGQKLVHQHKEPDGVTHGVSPPEHGTVDAVDEDLHEEVGTGRVLEQVPLWYQVLVGDHST